MYLETEIPLGVVVADVFHHLPDEIEFFGREQPGLHVVPDEVAVTGMDDSEISQIVTPTLTTVHLHYKTSGTETAKMLVSFMTGEEQVARKVKMSCEVVVRNSTR